MSGRTNPHSGVRVGSDRQVKCIITVCAHPREFAIAHPQRGEISVCSQHAKNIEKIGGEVISCE